MKHSRIFLSLLAVAALASCVKPEPIDPSATLVLSDVSVSASVNVPGSITVAAKVSDVNIALSTLNISAALEDGTEIVAERKIRTRGHEATVNETVDIPFAANMTDGAKVIVNLKAINVEGATLSQTAAVSVVRPEIPETIYMKIESDIFPMTKVGDNLYETEEGSYSSVATAYFATAEEFSEAPIFWGSSTEDNIAETCAFSDAPGVSVSYPTYLVSQFTFNTLTFEVGVKGEEVHVAVKGTELAPQAGGLLYANIGFTQGETLAITGINDLENAYNRDFFIPDGNGGFTFACESGNYDVYYSPRYNYIWVARMDAVAPDCLWIIGHGFTCAPVWHPDFSSDAVSGWATDYIYQLGYCVKVGEDLYQCSMYLSDQHTWGSFEFEIYSDLESNKTHGFGGTSLTGFTKGITLSGAGDGMPGLTSTVGFQPGYYVITFNNATGEINLDRKTPYQEASGSGIFINGVELMTEAAGYDCADIEFTTGQTVSLSGMDVQELNRDFFEIKDGNLAFVGVSGTYLVQHFPDYKYTWLNGVFSYPDCIYILGTGKFAAPEYSSYVGWEYDGWDQSAPAMVTAPRIADNTYKATMSMSTDNSGWSVLLEFYSDLDWNKEGLKNIELAGPAAARFYVDGEEDGICVCGVDEQEDPFVPGNYEFLITVEDGTVKINITYID